MPPLGLELSGLRATVETEALAERQVRLHVESGLLRLSPHGLTLLLPPGTPVAIRRVIPGRLLLHGSVDYRGNRLTGDAEVVPRVTTRGRIRLEVVSFRALGFIPVPIAGVTWFLRTRLSGKLGVHFGEGDHLEIDLAEILRTIGVDLPPLKAAHAGDGVAELEF